MKKLTSIIIAALMVLSVFTIVPITASAASNFADPCGENLLWAFDASSGTLTISGTGEMYDYTYESPCDYFNEYSSEIKTVVVSEGVTSIGNFAFAFCGHMESVTLPSSLTRIGGWAFAWCGRLTNVTIPDNVTTLGTHAFMMCENLKDVVIPKSVTSIDRSPFDDCKSIENIIVSEDNEKFYSVDGVLFDKDNGALIEYPIGNLRTEYVIPDGVKEIKEDAFYDCKNLKNVTIPDGVIKIKSEAFRFCRNLTEITIPDSVTHLGSSVFDGCNNLVSVKLSANTKYIDSCAFGGCEKLTSISIPHSVIQIFSYAFKNCESLTSVTISDGLTYISPEVFLGTGLTGVTIPASVKQIDDKAFGYKNSDGEKVADFTITGYTGSVAEKYAKDNGFKFISIGKVPSSTTPSTPKTEITLGKASGTVYLTGTIKVNATVKNGKGTTSYTSSNSKVAKVSKTGVVTGLKAGKATITVTNNGVSKKFTVTVKKPVLNKKAVSLKAKKSFTLKITGKVGKATFTSSNKKIATVNSKGKIVAKKKGNATITVKTNGIKLTCKVTVK